MNKWEIWLVEIPSSNGSEQAGTRPAIILADVSNLTVIVPLTSNIQALRFPYTLEIKPSNLNGLVSVSIALLFQIRAIDKLRLKKKIGNLEDTILHTLDNMLKKMLQLT